VWSVDGDQALMEEPRTDRGTCCSRSRS
jgi:hypothetical protein